MPLTHLSVQKYRSLRFMELPLRQLNVITGPNGSGKSNLYRALWLVAKICEGSFARSICREGGLPSVLWAGPRLSKKPVRMSLGFRTEDFSFELTCGFPLRGEGASQSSFCCDPEIKEEAVWHGPRRKPTTTLLERAGGITRIRDVEGARVEYPLILDSNESVLSQLREPHRFPELFSLREAVRGWRFYHIFRTDEESPMRSAQVSVRTPVLSHDGGDLAAALQTIIEIGDRHTLNEIIASALPGRTLEILQTETSLLIGMRAEGCDRLLLAHELSDGTLKFLCLVACLLSPRPPALIALNEPEASLHPDLLPPLAQLIVEASKFSQVWVSTHSTLLADAIRKLSGVSPLCLRLLNGETVVDE